MINWKILLLLSILLLVTGVAFGDYLIYHYEQKVTVSPNSSVVVSSAEVIVQGPPALAPAGAQEIGKVQTNNQVENVYTVSQATITNTRTTSFTILLIHYSDLFKFDFLLLGSGLLLLIISLLGFTYTKIVKRD
ncbi:hypothetical protein [Stygiolobus caldivivus]|uniref:Uncharacterized protein n=1 Tax=Stygiolobus caldivivus TaxID=2824673 RepID=A0A8D5U4R6_9CREN|nr:hypothetical protein [Stygiolobus caldivivus]BCU69445.1 hypothetical protein KN1_07420 [Stygiolobus caldivivus]